MSVPSFDDEERHALRGGFGADAEAYQRTRHARPASLLRPGGAFAHARGTR